MSLKRVSTGQGEETEVRKKVCTPITRLSDALNSVGNGSYPNGSEVAKEIEPEPYINKTQAALNYLRSLFPSHKFENRIPPLILRHQLYSVVPNRGLVDLQLEDMLNSGEIRLFPNGPHDSIIVMFSDDYRSYVLELAANLSLKPGIVDKLLDMQENVELTMSREQLVDCAKLEDDEITQLENAGLLMVADDDVWSLSLPWLNIFAKSFNLGRKAMLTVVSKCKYGEILQEELLQQKLPRVARLGTAYHVHDLVGANLVDTQKTSNGLLLRLRKSSSSSSSSLQTSLISFNADVDVYEESV